MKEKLAVLAATKRRYQHIDSSPFSLHHVRPSHVHTPNVPASLPSGRSWYIGDAAASRVVVQPPRRLRILESHVVPPKVSSEVVLLFVQASHHAAAFSSLLATKLEHAEPLAHTSSSLDGTIRFVKVLIFRSAGLVSTLPTRKGPA